MTEISARAGILAFHFNCVTIAAEGATSNGLLTPAIDQPGSA